MVPYDRLGIGPPEAGDAIYNGAKDNASRTSSALEMARAYANLDRRPGRSLRFAAVTGEDSGLIGSGYLARQPPEGRFIADINLDAIDMYGRTEDRVEPEGGQSTLRATFRRTTRYLGLRARGDPSPGHGHFFRSDPFSFVERGVPAAPARAGNAGDTSGGGP